MVLKKKGFDGNYFYLVSKKNLLVKIFLERKKVKGNENKMKVIENDKSKLWIKKKWKMSARK